MILSHQEPRIHEVAGAIVGDALVRLSSSRFANKNAGSLIVMDFTHCFRRLPEGTVIKDVVTNDKLFYQHYGDLIIFEKDYVDGEWKVIYKHIARAKAIMAAREQMMTSEILRSAPFFVRRGDVRYQGGVYLHGVSAGFSGVQPEWDETLASIAIDIFYGDAQTEVGRDRDEAFFE